MVRKDKIIFDKDILLQKYSEFCSLRKVAKELGCSEKTIKRRMNEHGIEYAPRINYICDELFFSELRRSLGYIS